MRRWLPGLLTMVTCICLSGQNKVSTTEQMQQPDSSWLERVAGLGDKVLDVFTWESSKHSFAIFPSLGFSHRTQLEMAIIPVWQIKPHRETTLPYYRPTTITPSLMISTTHMFKADLDLLTFTHSGWCFQVKNQFLYLPDKFFGIGNNGDKKPMFEYDIRRFSFVAEVLKGFREDWFVGTAIDFSFSDHDPTEDEFFSDRVRGRLGGWSNGLGPVVMMDRRNHTTFPTQGSFLKFSGLVFSKSFGSDYRFIHYSADWRYYHPVGEDNVVASQFYVETLSGNPPFFKLCHLGGKSRVRGIPYPQQYLDESMWLLQSEFRKHIWWRIGAAGFAGIGNVFHQPEKSLTDLHCFVGLGLRAQAFPKEKLNFRIDGSITNRGDQAVYFTIQEAF